MKKFVEHLKIAGALFGKELSEPAIMLMVKLLSNYDEKILIESVEKCILTKKFFPTVSDIIENINTGHPGVEEAWAMIPKNEDDTGVMTQVMQKAWAACYPMIEGDLIAARMTFKEVYQKELLEANANGEMPQWRVTLGYDKSKRIAALSEAVALQRIPYQQAKQHVYDLPEPGKPQIQISEETKKLFFNGNLLKDIPK